MSVSLFDLFKVGLGPSSSHTVGPMKAGVRFGEALAAAGLLPRVAQVRAELFGSLALTGKGHATDSAVILGLAGHLPDKIDPDQVAPLLAGIAAEQSLPLAGAFPVPFVEARDLLFQMAETLPRHTNGLRFTAYDAEGGELLSRITYSVGGGFILDEAEFDQVAAARGPVLPFPFNSGAELLGMGMTSGLSIAQMVMANELALRPRAEVEEHLRRVWEAMQACVKRGLSTEGILPGGLRVKRRAPGLHRAMQRSLAANQPSPTLAFERASLYAIAVNEENACGGRVVTAPTNGAAGLIPAVLHYFKDCWPELAQEEKIFEFLLTATAIGSLFKTRASISGAEVGCQGEVGVACSMAAAGLAAALGGSNAQIENAAEIGMEHNLGLTCDPIAGLVQIPCIERNAMGAVKAINAAALALQGDGTHRVSLDQVIETMRQTGHDMMTKYKETAQGGLAVNVVAC
ncbi:L-serine dehydratase [Elstera cyanobacteriorum]|uniref:L-serine dehydratase n=1 Tax=Elstera cyanobacteriorum TaxID=2022747 RepID=A0A255XK06_9PROT|nr:L-serine ammonia-lyase [Elstera cyanobacteriorum]OYQ17307.1 L-serine ammonia-lyase [Elstera cyanobacteriorum]GFZ92926.1 L-serine dehydratase [Elstera cyanobacteriorum]